MDKSIKVKARILKESVMLFEEYGYNNTTIRMIAEKASIGRGNLTYHFPKKEDISRLLMKVFFIKIERFNKDIISDESKNAYVYFAILLKSFEYFIDNNDYFKMMVLDGEKSQMIFRHSSESYYELIQKKLIINNKEYDLCKLKRSINFGVLIFDNIILNKLKYENEYNVEATYTAIRHFMLEINEAEEYINHVMSIANATFEKINLNNFYSYIMGYDYEDILRELEELNIE